MILVRGTVKDEAGRPLPGANVRLWDSSSQSFEANHLSQTNDFGQFVIEIDEEYYYPYTNDDYRVLRITHVGKRTKDLDLTGWGIFNEPPSEVSNFNNRYPGRTNETITLYDKTTELPEAIVYSDPEPEQSEPDSKGVWILVLALLLLSTSKKKRKK